MQNQGNETESGEKLEDIGVRCGGGTKTNSVDGIMFKIL